MKEQLFVRSVAAESYRAYLLEFYTGQSKRGYAPSGRKWRRLHRDKPHPLSRQSHRNKWYASQKARWVRYDVPNMMSQRFEAENG